MRNFLVFFLLIICLVGCTDSPFDKRGYSYNKQKFKNEEDSLNKLCDDNEIEFYFTKYQFENLKSLDTLPENVKDKYYLWNDWKYAAREHFRAVNEATAIDSAFALSALSICIGLITLRLLVLRKKIYNKWLKFIFFSGITFLLWLGTSCYAFLFMKYPIWISPESDITFFTLSTQFKFLPFMIVWLAHTIFIGLIVISLNRLFIHLFSVIDLEINKPGYLFGKVNMAGDHAKQLRLRVKKRKIKDERLKNLLLYVCSSFVLFFLYYQTSLVSNLELVRFVIAKGSISDYWFLPLIAVVFVIIYFTAGSLLNDEEKIINKIDENA